MKIYLVDGIFRRSATLVSFQQFVETKNYYQVNHKRIYFDLTMVDKQKFVVLYNNQQEYNAIPWEWICLELQIKFRQPVVIGDVL